MVSVPPSATRASVCGGTLPVSKYAVNRTTCRPALLGGARVAKCPLLAYHGAAAGHVGTTSWLVAARLRTSRCIPLVDSANRKDREVSMKIVVCVKHVPDPNYPMRVD